MSPSSGGFALNGSAALVQTGTVSCVTDSSPCNQGPFYAWYEFLPLPPVACNSLNANDQVSVDVINEKINMNGDPKKWDIHNTDTSTSTSCTPIVGYNFDAGSVPYYAQYINEGIVTVNGFKTVIPKFGSDTMTGYMFDNNNGFQSISKPYFNGYYNIDYALNNDQGQNINFGGALSGSFIQFWSPNCSTPGTGTAWTVQTSCTLVSNYAAGANIEVSPGSILTVSSGTKLMTDLTQNKITIDNNGGLLVEAAGKISKN